MTRRWTLLGLTLILGACIAGSCSVPLQEEKDTPYDPSMALDAALAYVRAHSGRSAPAAGPQWAEENVTPAGQVGGMAYRYTAEDWTVTLSHGVVNPASVVYTVVIDGKLLGFHWEGTVDAQGVVTPQ
jgi:hypothetical protein